MQIKYNTKRVSMSSSQIIFMEKLSTLKISLKYDARYINSWLLLNYCRDNVFILYLNLENNLSLCFWIF